MDSSVPTTSFYWCHLLLMFVTTIIHNDSITNAKFIKFLLVTVLYLSSIAISRAAPSSHKKSVSVGKSGDSFSTLDHDKRNA